jgi:hypothetical protein
MNGLQFGNNEDVDIGGGHAILKMQRHGFADVFVELVNSFALRKDVFADAPSAPKVTVVIDFYFHQHDLILQRLGATGHLCFYFWAKWSRGTRAKRVARRVIQTATKAAKVRTAYSTWSGMGR